MKDNMNKESLDATVQIVTVILALGGVVSPLVYGYIIYKMSQVFVSKNDFIEFKAEQKEKHDDNKVTLHDINNDIKMILTKGKFEQ